MLLSLLEKYCTCITTTDKSERKSCSTFIVCVLFSYLFQKQIAWLHECLQSCSQPLSVRTTLCRSSGDLLSQNCAVYVGRSARSSPVKFIICLLLGYCWKWTLLHCLLFCLWDSWGECVYSLHTENSCVSLDQIVQLCNTDTILYLVFAKLWVNMWYTLSKFLIFYVLVSFPLLFSFSCAPNTCFFDMYHIPFKIVFNSFWGRIVVCLWYLESKLFISSLFHYLIDYIAFGKSLNVTNPQCHFSQFSHPQNESKSFFLHRVFWGLRRWVM